jgi:hypothetical protein
VNEVQKSSSVRRESKAGGMGRLERERRSGVRTRDESGSALWAPGLGRCSSRCVRPVQQQDLTAASPASLLITLWSLSSSAVTLELFPSESSAEQNLGFGRALRSFVFVKDVPLSVSTPSRYSYSHCSSTAEPLSFSRAEKRFCTMLHESKAELKPSERPAPTFPFRDLRHCFQSLAELFSEGRAIARPSFAAGGVGSRPRVLSSRTGSRGACGGKFYIVSC